MKGTKGARNNASEYFTGCPTWMTYFKKCCLTAQSTSHVIMQPRVLRPQWNQWSFQRAPSSIAAVDKVGPFKWGTYDCRCAITHINYFSKWPEVAFTSSSISDTVITFLACFFAQEVNRLCNYDGQFTSAAFAVFLNERNIKHIRSNVYHPLTNGCIECFSEFIEYVRTVFRQLRVLKDRRSERSLHFYRATSQRLTQQRGNPLSNSWGVDPWVQSPTFCHTLQTQVNINIFGVLRLPNWKLGIASGCASLFV